MADVDDDRDEEWFKEVYGSEYTGPSRQSRDNMRHDSSNTKTRSGATSATCEGNGTDEEGEHRDPNAVPTDFTSREAKVWEAKAKAVERNWKRRKEEELTCRICGEVGHFAQQGCPTTLGGNRKQAEIVERISFRDKRLKPRLIGTGGAVIQGIEKDTGCRLKLEDSVIGGSGSFCVRISGPDGVNVGKAADVVNKLVEQVEDERKQPGIRRLHGGGSIGSDNGRGTSSGSDGDRRAGDRCESFRGSNLNPLIAAQMQHIAVQRLQHSGPISGSLGRGEARPLSLDEDKRTIEHIASQLEARRQWEATSGSQGGNETPPYQCKGGSLSELEPGRNLGPDEMLSAQTLDELENRFLQETIDLTKEQNAEEYKEDMKHRERMKEIQGQYQEEMTILRSKHAKQREEFLCHKARLRQHQYHTGYGNYQCSSGGSIPPLFGLSYNGSYACSAHTTVADNVPGYGRLGVYESFQDASPMYGSKVSRAYGKRQGYDNSKGYVTQVYNPAPHLYGNSPSY